MNNSRDVTEIPISKIISILDNVNINPHKYNDSNDYIWVRDSIKSLKNRETKRI